MKKSYLLTGLILLAAGPGFAQLKVGAPGAPDSSAMLEITSGPSGNKGLLLPRMTTAQRNAINDPATGLMIFNTTTQEVQVNTGTPAAPTWATATATANGWSVTGNSGTTPLTNFFGTTDNQPLVFRTNNAERMRLTSAGNLGLGLDSALVKLHVNDGSFRVANGSTELQRDAIEVISDGGGPDRNDNITIRSFGPTTQPSFGTSSARGTFTSPENSQAGDNIGNVYFNAYVNGGERSQSVITSQYLGDGTTNRSRLTFRTQTQPAMTVDSNSRIGIGTVNPQQRLHVQGTARITGSSGTATTITGRNADGDISNVTIGDGLSLTGGTLTATAGGNNWGLTGNTGSNPANNFIGTADSQAVVIRTNNAEQLRVTAVGDVGVGINDPQTKMHLNAGAFRISNGSTPLATDAFEIINDGGGPGNNDNVTIRSFGAVNQPSIGTATARGSLSSPENSQAGDNIGNFFFSARVNGVEQNQNVIVSQYLGDGTNNKSRMTIRTSNTNAMTIDSSTNVGIGTTSPQSKLHINSGAFTISNGPGQVSRDAITIINDNGGEGKNDNIVIKSYGSSGNPSIGTFSSRGTAAAPVNSQPGDNLGNFYFSARVNGSEQTQNLITSDYLGDGTNNKSRLSFITGNAVAMAIDSNQNVGFGTSAPKVRLHARGALLVAADANPSHANGAFFGWNTIRSNTGEAEFVNYRGTGLGGFRFYEVNPGGSTAQAIYPNHYIAYIQPGTGNYTTPSDARVKSNIVTINDGLEKVMQLNPVSYDLHSNKAIKNGAVVTTGNDRTIKSVGFLAQELQKVLPEAVIVPKDPANDLYSVSYATVVPLLTKAIQELNTKVEKLEAENAQLRADASTVSELLNRIKQLEQVVLTNNTSSSGQTALK